MGPAIARSRLFHLPPIFFVRRRPAVLNHQSALPPWWQVPFHPAPSSRSDDRHPIVRRGIPGCPLIWPVRDLRESARLNTVSVRVTIVRNRRIRVNVQDSASNFLPPAGPEFARWKRVLRSALVRIPVRHTRNGFRPELFWPVQSGSTRCRRLP